MLVNQFQNAAAATSDTGQGVFGGNNRQTGFFHQQAVQVLEQGAATGQYNAAFGDVGTQFRRGLFKCGFDSADDTVQRLLQGFQNLIAVQ